MFIYNNCIDLYGRKVITDLALRSGMATTSDYSYGLGLNYIVKKFWFDPNDSNPNLEALLEEQEDFNADRIQPLFSEEDYNDSEETSANAVPYSVKEDPVTFNRYYRRLEDVAYQYLEKYLGNIVYSVCHNTNYGVQAYNSKHRIQPTLQYSGSDEDDYTELSDLAIEEDDDWSLDAKTAAAQNLPYVLKRLHNMSCYTRVHMLSYVCAYVKAVNRQQLRVQSGSVRTLKANDVIREGVWLCDNEGNATKQVYVENKNKRALSMFDWISHTPNSEYKEYYQDYINFIHDVKVLGIDIINDDMSKYGAEFISKLIVTTVTPNKQYDHAVFKALSMNASTAQPERVVNPVKNTIDCFNQLCSLDSRIIEVVNKHNDRQRSINVQNAESLLNLYYVFYLGKSVDTSKISWDYGWMKYNGELVILPCGWFYSEFGAQDQCILNELGYAVQLTTDMDICMMTLNNALENAHNSVIAHDSSYKYSEWVRYIS